MAFHLFSSIQIHDKFGCASAAASQVFKKYSPIIFARFFASFCDVFNDFVRSDLVAQGRCVTLSAFTHETSLQKVKIARK